MRKMKVRSISIDEEHLKLLQELINLGLAENVSEAIRRSIEIVDGIMKEVQKGIKSESQKRYSTIWLLRELISRSRVPWG